MVNECLPEQQFLLFKYNLFTRYYCRQNIFKVNSFMLWLANFLRAINTIAQTYSVHLPRDTFQTFRIYFKLFFFFQKIPNINAKVYIYLYVYG